MKIPLSRKLSPQSRSLLLILVISLLVLAGAEWLSSRSAENAINRELSLQTAHVAEKLAYSFGALASKLLTLKNTKAKVSLMVEEEN